MRLTENLFSCTLIKCLLACSPLLAGCSSSLNQLTVVPPPTRDTQLAGGYISVNRVAPPVASPEVLLGFMPPASSRENTSWLRINVKEKLLALMQGDKVIDQTGIQGELPLVAGIYELKHKQRSPLWYAGDEYFKVRGLTVPKVGDKERYRRGALGDFALFVDSESSIHSSPIWTPEVGGLRVEDEKMKKIYYSLEAGASIEVQ